MTRKSFPLSNVYGLLEPGPVVLITTAHKGRANVMTQSWHTMMEFEPPLVGCVISDRNYSYDMLNASKECVINIPTVELTEQVVGCGNVSGADVDKFEKFDLTAAAAKDVRAPLIDECFANLECKVVDTRMVNKYGFFVLEVVSAWTDPAIRNPRTVHHLGRGNFMVAGELIKTKSKMK
jgi:flavin reductase (DIM6/NTAB) family NADH-FMN oxidoreductase RutF